MEAEPTSIARGAPTLRTVGRRSWRPLTSPNGRIASLAAATDGSIILVGTTKDVHCSDDAGFSWQPTGFSGTAVTVPIAPSDPRAVAAIDDKTRCFRSDDGGATRLGPK